MLALVSISALAQAPGPNLRPNAASTPRQIPASPPPMGWSSWNSFSNTIDSNIVVQQTKALVSSGLKDAGYEYINIDEGWWLGKRDANSNMIVDPHQSGRMSISPPSGQNPDTTAPSGGGMCRSTNAVSARPDATGSPARAARHRARIARLISSREGEACGAAMAVGTFILPEPACAGGHQIPRPGSRQSQFPREMLTGPGDV